MMNVILTVAVVIGMWTWPGVDGAAPRDTRCPGGYSDGTQIDIGMYWYECRNGKVSPKGCLTNDRRRVGLSETYDKDNVRIRCTLDDDGHPTMIYEACVADGRARMPDQDWDEDNVWYSCEHDGAGLRARTVGCATSDLGRVKLDQRVSRGDLVYKCVSGAGGRPIIRDNGCFQNGQQYAVGDTFDHEGRWFTCTRDAQQRIRVRCIGCVRDGKRFQHNDGYEEEDIIYRCNVDGDKTDFRPSACIQHRDGVRIDRRIGCFWVEGNRPYQYQMTCRYDPATNIAVKVQTRCEYIVEGGGTYNLGPNCYYPTGEQSAIGCWQDPQTSRLSIRSYTLRSDGTIAATGLSQC